MEINRRRELGTARGGRAIGWPIRYDRPVGVERLDAPEGSWTPAMNARTGVTLRLIGPLIEVACLFGLLRVRDRGIRVLGLPAEYPLYAGLALGLTLVVIGLAFVRAETRRPGDRP